MRSTRQEKMETKSEKRAEEKFGTKEETGNTEKKKQFKKETGRKGQV
jgi:hypothetical protein